MKISLDRLMNFISFDLETTGLNSGLDKITEIGAVKYIDGQPQSMFCTLVDPGSPIPVVASQITGITDDMVKGKPSIEQLLEPFTKFCEGLPLFAYNASFDFQFLSSGVTEHKLCAPTGPVFDILALSKVTFKGLQNYKLGTVIQFLNIQTDASFHRAGADAHYCALVLMEVFKKHFLSFSEVNCEKLQELTGRVPLRFPQVEDRQINLV